MVYTFKDNNSNISKLYVQKYVLTFEQLSDHGMTWVWMLISGGGVKLLHHQTSGSSKPLRFQFSQIIIKSLQIGSNQGWPVLFS